MLPENTIGQKLKKLRLRLGLTQSQFGKSINKALTTIANLENGYRMPTNDILESIIRLYKLDKNYFKS